MTWKAALVIALSSLGLFTACRGEGDEARSGSGKNDGSGGSLRPSGQRFEPTWSGRESPNSSTPGTDRASKSKP